MNSHQFSLVLLNIIAASSCFGLETIKFSRVLFLSCMSNQASSVRSIYLPPLKYRKFSIFMIEVCKKSFTYTTILDYGGSVYYLSTKKKIQLIENVQRRATRILPEMKGLSYGERLQLLKLLTMHFRRKRYDLIQLLFKIVHGYEDIRPEKFFEFNDNSTRGQLFKIVKPRCQKNFRSNCFPVRCINKWNALSEVIVCSDTVLKFKSPDKVLL